MTKTEVIAHQALRIAELERDLTRAKCPATLSYAEGDPRGRHPHKWEEIRRLQMRMSDINAKYSAIAEKEVALIQAEINRIWVEITYNVQRIA